MKNPVLEIKVADSIWITADDAYFLGEVYTLLDI